MNAYWKRWGSIPSNMRVSVQKILHNSDFSHSSRFHNKYRISIGILLLFISFLLVGTFATRAQQNQEVFLPLVTADWDGNQIPVVVIKAFDDHYLTQMNSPLIVNAADGILANDTITSSDQLEAVLAADVAHGDLKLNKDGSFEYSPSSGFTGQDTFTYRATNGTKNSNLATVSLTVESVTNNKPVIVSGEVAFTNKIIGIDFDLAHYLIAADLDGDGDNDVAATDYGNGRVDWLENDGSGNFTKRELDPDLEGAYPAHIGDVDLDGDPDVFIGGYLADIFAWYRNDGGGSFTRIDIDTEADGAHSLVTGDLDDDGDIDLVTSWQDAATIAWYENDGSQNFQRHIIDTTALKAKRAEIADVDGDGDKDIFTAADESNEIAWLENDGSENFTKHIIRSTDPDGDTAGAYYVAPADIDGDGDMDVFSASRLSHTVAWHENDGSEYFIYHELKHNAYGVRTVIAADIDRDGDMDAISASVDDDTVRWYNNDGNGNFTIHTIDAAADGAYGLFAIDMDFDGDVDVLSAANKSGMINLHAQFKAHTASVNANGTLVIDSDLLLTTDAEEGPAALIYTLETAAQYGQVQVDGLALSGGGTFTQDDVNNGRLTYVHGGGLEAQDEFTLTVTDGAAGHKPADGTFTIQITN